MHHKQKQLTSATTSLSGLRLGYGNDLQRIDTGFGTVCPRFCEAAVYHVAHAADGD